MSAVPCSNRAPTVVDGQRIRFPRGTAILDSVVWAVSIVVATRLAPDEGACGGGGLVAGAVMGLAVGLHTVIDALFASNRRPAHIRRSRRGGERTGAPDPPGGTMVLRAGG